MTEQPQLQKIRNDNKDDIKPMWGLFVGKWAIIPIIGMATGLTIYNTLSFAGMDILSCLIAAATPVSVMTAMVVLFVNNKPPGYAEDLIKQGWFKVDEWLYVHGFSDHPPQLWYSAKPIRNPRL